MSPARTIATPRRTRSTMRNIRTLFATMTLALALAGMSAGVAQADPDPAQFAIVDASASFSSAQAGAHGDFTNTLEIARDPATDEVHARMRDVTVDLPPGLVGNPRLFPTCSIFLFAAFHDFSSEACPRETQVGVVTVSMKSTFTLDPTITFTEPLYNLPAPKGSPARLGFIGLFYPVMLDFKVRSNGDVVAISRGINASRSIHRVEVTTWGVPADPSHDELRRTPQEAVFEDIFGAPVPPQPSSLPPAPFTSNATSCAASNLHFDVLAYERPGEHFTADAALPALTGCQDVPFNPLMQVVPTSATESAPTGLKFDLSVSQTGLEDETRLRPADLKKAVVTMPEGMTINPAAAKGRAACSAEQVGLTSSAPISFDSDPAECPNASKVGEVEIETPLLEESLTGSLFLADQNDNPFNTLLSGYMVAEGAGVIIKLAGRFDLDPTTGQVTATFDNNPQQPFSSLHLEFYGGPNGPLTNPDCGSHTVSAQFEGWNGTSVERSSTFTIDQGCTPPQFNPTLSAGLQQPLAGSSSPFVLRIQRTDADNELKTVATQVPPGLLAKLAGVPRCSNAQAAAANCPAASQIGQVTVGAGSGPDPVYISGGRVFLTDGYNGAPVGLAATVSAATGPFDLGMVNVRDSLEVDPITAQVSVHSDPIPRILQGIPLQVRDVRVAIDRPEFIQTPTNCDPMSIGSTIGSWANDAAARSNPFQLGGCAGLGFKPRMTLRLRGGTRRGKYPALTARIMPRPGDANIASVSLSLPRSEFLANEHIGTVCTRPAFAADQCPAGAIYGKATVQTPLLDDPLTGHAFLRSSDNLLPDLVTDLRGPASLPIKLETAGRTDSIRDGIRNTFDFIPDAPFSKATVAMRGGAKGLLVNSRNICARTYRAVVRYTAHNGDTFTARPKLRAQCGKKRGKKSKGKRGGHRRAALSAVSTAR